MNARKDQLVFVVEDNVLYAELIKLQLHKLGFERVEHFTNGTDCVNNIYKQPHYVLLDYHLGDMTGVEVLKEIQGLNPDIITIFLSGQEKVDIAVQSLKYGAFDYLIKGEETLQELDKVVEKVERLKGAVDASDRKRAIRKKLSILGVGILVVLAVASSYFLKIG